MYYVTIDYGYTTQHLDNMTPDWNEAMDTFDNLVEMYDADEYIVLEVLSFDDSGEIQIHRRVEGRED